MDVIDVPVLIVGGGPAGLTASLLLSRHGVESLLVDKRGEGASRLPRARGVHARAMEIMRVCGIEADLRAVELPITPGGRWQPRLTTPPIHEEVIAAAVPAGISPCEGLAVSQDVFESVLRMHARSYALARLRLGTRLDRFDVTKAGIDAVVVDQVSARPVRVHARWMIAADGAHSSIRDRLDIAMTGPDDLGSQTMIAFRADLSAYTGANPRGIYFLTDTGAVLIWTHPDDRWVISIPEADTGHDGDPRSIVRDVLGVADLPVDVYATNRWTAAAQTAHRYAHGPVFLTGDAAHRFPPTGATGVSAAMHDVHNLAWKLAAVWHGHAGDTLLDSYALERQPVGRTIAEETGTAWTRMLTGNTMFAGRSLAQLDMGYQYRSAVITSDASPDADPPGADYQPTATPGCRAPHLWLHTPQGRRSTIDLFDRHFVLLTTRAGRAWRHAAADAAQAMGVPVDRPVIDEPEWPQRYGVNPDGAVLVRPDGHVAWRARATPARHEPTVPDQIRAAIATGLGRD